MLRAVFSRCGHDGRRLGGSEAWSLPMLELALPTTWQGDGVSQRQIRRFSGNLVVLLRILVCSLLCFVSRGVGDE